MLYLCMFLTGLKKVAKTEGKSWLWNLNINTARWRVMISDGERAQNRIILQ